MKIEIVPLNWAQLAGKGGIETDPAAFEKGEVVNARAIAKNSDTIVFRSEDGRVFAAKLSESLLVLPGDRAEFMVTSSLAGRVVLHLLNIDAAQPHAAAEPGVLSSGTNFDVAAAQTAKLLQSMDRTAFSETIKQAADLVKNQGLSVEEAVFFASNRKEATQEQVGTLRSFAKGETLGTVLDEIITALKDAEGAAPPRRFAAAEAQPELKNPAENPVPQHTGEAGASETAAKPAAETAAIAKGTQAPPDIERPVPPPTAGEIKNNTARAAAGETDFAAKQAELVPEQPNRKTEIAAPSSGAANPGTKSSSQAAQTPQARPDAAVNERLSAAASGGTGAKALAAEPVEFAPDEGRQSAAPQTENKPLPKAEPQSPAVSQNQGELYRPKEFAALMEKLISAFVKMDGSTSGASVKRSAAAVKDELVALAGLTAADAGSKETQTLAPKMMRAAEQGMLFQNMDRIAFAQIPIRLNQYDTAELYVYKRAKRGGSIDAENTSMLIGLTTEHLGRVEALVRVERKNLFLSFYVEDQALTAEVEEKADELIAALGGLGFFVAGVKAGLLKERTTPQNAEKTLACALQRTGMGIDCRI